MFPDRTAPATSSSPEKSASALLAKYGSLDAIQAARTVVAPVLDCRVGDVGAVGRVIEALAQTTPPP